MKFTQQFVNDYNARLATTHPSIAQGVKKVAAIPEAKIHAHIEEECRKRGWYIVHSRMDVRTTNAKGVPDFIIFPTAHPVFVVECKSGNKKLTIEQCGVMAWFRKYGKPHYVVRSVEEFDQILKGYQ